MKERHLALGLMSGTSLDGLDLAACEFVLESGTWNYKILEAATVRYPKDWKENLANLHKANALTFWKIHVEYGHFLGQKINEFILNNGITPHLVCSHGHTVFHNPGSGYTMQAGSGEAIAAVTGLPVVSDFRSADVAMGGQGAPLVPMGDRLLFRQYGACLNIGGFSNVSYEADDQRLAFDICPSNIVLNHLASMVYQPYDQGGMLARTGKKDAILLNRLNGLSYYKAPPPKSLGREWFDEIFLPIVSKDNLSIIDLLRTCNEHIGFQIGQALNVLEKTNVLITGGGAHNTFLIETIGNHCKHELVVPDSILVDYKEALVFAFLGVLRWKGEINILSSATGGRENHSGGAVYNPFPHN